MIIMTKKKTQQFWRSFQWEPCPTWVYEREQIVCFADITIREGDASQDCGPFASQAGVQRDHKKVRVWPVKSQGSWKWFTYTNLVDPYFELRSADTVFTNLSLLKVLRRNKRLIKKIFQKAVTWVGFQLSHSNHTNLKNNHTILKNCHKLFGVAQWMLLLLTSSMETKYCQVSVDNSCWNVAGMLLLANV